MARPVKETPVLKGKDARHFEQVIKRNEVSNKVPSEDYRRAMAVFKSIKLRS